jgi:hypothetical protein
MHVDRASTRRTFLKGSALAGAALLGGGALPAPPIDD